MAKTTSNSLKIEVWGSDRVAQGASALVDPSQSTIEKGFVDGIANANDFTWVPNILGGKINHCLQNGIPLWNNTTAYVAGNMVTHSNKAWQCLVGNTNSTPADGNANWDKVLTATQEPVLPNGYLNAPVPTYDSVQPKRVNFNGALTARTQDNTANIVLASASRNLDLATSGANGLADGLTVANNTWYYVYAYSGGYVASTTNGASTLTIGTVVQKVVQLPLTLRTDSSANILPFVLEEWNGKSSTVLYRDTEDTSAYRVLSSGSASSFTAVSCSSLVPPLSRVAMLNVSASGDTGGGAGGVWTRETDSTISTGKRVALFNLASGNWDSPSLYANTQTLNSSQQFDYRRNAGFTDINVLGYTINL